MDVQLEFTQDESGSASFSTKRKSSLIAISTHEFFLSLDGGWPRYLRHQNRTSDRGGLTEAMGWALWQGGLIASIAEPIAKACRCGWLATLGHEERHVGARGCRHRLRQPGIGINSGASRKNLLTSPQCGSTWSVLRAGTSLPSCRHIAHKGSLRSLRLRHALPAASSCADADACSFSTA